MNIVPTVQPNSSAVAFLILVLCAGAIGIVILISHYSNFWQAKRLTAFRFSSKKFQELADAADLSGDEKKFLEEYFRRTKIPRFLEIFYNYRFGQSIMRQIYRATFTHPDNFSDEPDLARYYVFSMTQKLENFLSKNVFANCTQKIADGTRFYIEIPSQAENPDRYVAKMRSNRRSYFEVQLLSGHPSHIPKGRPIKIEILKDGDHAIYSSKVRAYSDSRQRKKLLVIDHSKKPQIILGARRYNRKQLQTSSTIVSLRSEDASFAANGETINGLLCDISMTGCGILSHIQFPKNSFIGISYLNPYDNETIRFICEIMGYTKLRKTEINAVILQCRIEKIDLHDRNLISAFVYNFENENNKIKKLLDGDASKVSIFDSDTAAVLRGKF